MGDRSASVASANPGRGTNPAGGEALQPTSAARSIRRALLKGPTATFSCRRRPGRRHLLG